VLTHRIHFTSNHDTALFPHLQVTTTQLEYQFLGLDYNIRVRRSGDAWMTTTQLRHELSASEEQREVDGREREGEQKQKMSVYLCYTRITIRMPK
jgi:hypothetical protein